MIKTNVIVILLYVVISKEFDKHLYLTSCLNAHNHNTCMHLPQNTLYCAYDSSLLVRCKGRQK